MDHQPDLRAALADAVAMQKAGDRDTAARMYRALLESAPDFVPALCLLANLERQRGEFDLAGRRLKRALELAPDTPAAIQEAGLLALVMDRPKEAVAYLRRLVAARPQYPDGQFNLGHALEKSGRPEQAIDAYRTAIELGVARAWEAQTRIGSCLVALGREREADRYFDQALAQAPDFAPALFGKGMAKMAFGDFERAGQRFEEALLADPGLVEVYQQVVELRKFDSMDEPLVRSMQKLLGEPGRSRFTCEKLHFGLGKVANDCGEYDAAFRHYSAAKALKKERQPPYDHERFADLVRRTEKSFTNLPEAEVGAGCAGPTPVFIIGMPRSGTTLAEQILSCHSLINGAGELGFMDGLSRRAETGYPEAVPAQDAAWRRASREAYLGELAPFSGDARYVTDKFPGNYLHVGLIATLFPEALFIHCRRDPTDTCLSIFFQDFATGNYYANDLEDIALRYSGYARLMQHWERVAGSRIHTLQYEDLVADQEKQIRAMLAFLGVDWEPDCLRSHENPRKVSTLSRWQVRQPVYSGSCERWRHYERHIGALIRALPDARQPGY